MTGIHCDAKGCHAWATTSMARKAGFVCIDFDGGRFDFCSTDHALAWLATFPPVREVEA